MVRGDRMHRCPIGDCTVRVPRERLMCPRHWQLVPAKLKRALRRAWGNGAGRRQPRAPRGGPRVHPRRARQLPPVL